MENLTQASIDPTGKVDGVSIRRAVHADLSALIALENATFSSDRLSPRQWRRHLDNANAEIWVAEMDAQAGAAAVLFYRKGSRLARLYSLAVATGLRGRGVGEALLDACERAARLRGCDRLRLEVRRDNVVAERLYQRRGYQLFAQRPDYYEDGETASCYEKALVLV